MTDERTVEFGTLHSDGTVTDVRDIAACPHYILVAGHYRDDGTCRCNDPGHSEMIEWGYRWRDGLWR
jgi:hypothetical protein